MAKAVHLTSAQKSQLLTAAYAVKDPEAFTRAVRQRLEALPEVGDGILYRVCRSLQPQFFDPPLDHVEKSTHRPQLFRKKV